MLDVTASVGIRRGKQCRNRVADQQTVLSLLDQIPPEQGGNAGIDLEWMPPQEGFCQEDLHQAIRAFQQANRAEVQFVDGHVDPGLATIRCLNRLAEQAGRTEPVEPERTGTAPAEPGGEPVRPSHVMVELAEGPPGVDDLVGLLAPMLSGLRLAFGDLRVERAYSSLSVAEIRELLDEARAASGTEPPDLLAHLVVEGPPGTDPDALAAQLRELPLVADAWPDDLTELALVEPVDDPESWRQSYLEPAPGGLDAGYAWGIPGGDGSRVTVAVIDLGAAVSTPQLAGRVTQVTESDSNLEHGTSCLGILVAEDDTELTVGMVPAAPALFGGARGRSGPDGRTRAGSGDAVGDAVMSVAQQMAAGDVMSISLGWQGRPIEMHKSVYKPIVTAVQKGIVVVTSANNKAEDLDATTPGPAFVHPVAIVVGSADRPSDATGWTRRPSSNRGSAVDAFARGGGVATISAAGTLVPGFTGTSAATPQVAGALAAVQSMRRAAGLPVLDQAGARALLRDPARTTPLKNPAADRIGRMPDLRRIANQDGLFRTLPPAVCLRADGTVLVARIEGGGDLMMRALGSGTASHAGQIRFPAAGRPAIVSRRPGIADAFCVGGRGHLLTTFDTGGGWAGPRAIGVGTPFGTRTHLAAVARRADQPGQPSHLDVVGVGRDGQLYTTSWDEASGAWAPLAPIGGGRIDPGSPVVLLARKPDVLDVFAVASNGQVMTTSWQESTNAWAQLAAVGGAMRVDPRSGATAVARNPDHLDVFGITGQGQLVSTFWPAGGGWAEGFPVPGAPLDPGGGLSVVARSPDHLDVFGLNPDGFLHTTWWEPSGGWGPVSVVERATPLAVGGLAAAAPAPDRLDVVAVNRRDDTLRIFWTQQHKWGRFVAG